MIPFHDTENTCERSEPHDATEDPTNYSLPFLNALAVVGKMEDALAHAVRTRVGVLVYGPKGVGKSAARRHAVRTFLAAEDTRAEQDPSHIARSVLFLPASREERYGRALDALVGALSNRTVPLSRHQRATDDETVRATFIDRCLLQERVLIVVEEIERASDAFLLALRDIMADAKDRDPRTQSDAVDGHGNLQEVPAGMGVLAIGTEHAAERILRSREAGHAWAHPVPVAKLEPQDVAEVLRFWLPQTETYIAREGDTSWQALVYSRMCGDKPRTIREVAHATRLYLTRCAQAGTGSTSRLDTPFDEERWLLAWRDSQWT